MGDWGLRHQRAVQMQHLPLLETLLHIPPERHAFSDYDGMLIPMQRHARYALTATQKNIFRALGKFQRILRRI